jgi:hypothetical protein
VLERVIAPHTINLRHVFQTFDHPPLPSG